MKEVSVEKIMSISSEKINNFERFELLENLDKLKMTCSYPKFIRQAKLMKKKIKSYDSATKK